MVVSQNFSSATSGAKFAPINTETAIPSSREIMWEMSSMPPPGFLSNPWINKMSMLL